MLRCASSLVIAAYEKVHLIPQDSRALPAAFLRNRTGTPFLRLAVGLKRILLGLPDMNPHHPFTQFRVFEFEGQENLPVTVDGSLCRTEVLEGILPISQHVLPHIHNKVVETTLVRNHAVQGVMELGVPLKYLVDPFPPEGGIRFLDDLFK